MHLQNSSMAVVSLGLLVAACGSSHTEVPDRQGNGENGEIAEAVATPSAVNATGFYVDPNSASATWVKNNGGDARAASIKSNIADKAAAHWFGNWDTNISADVSNYVAAAAAKSQWPILVSYNVPGRDCGGASSGGAGSPAAFRTWISSFAGAVGSRQAIVIIEPDSLAQLDCLPSDADRQTRLDLILYASQQFQSKAPNARAYLDAGHTNWIAAATMAQRLNAAGVHNVRGFALDVSNFYTTSETTTYAKSINSALSSQSGSTAQYVIDTSRNANGSNGQWCNPAGRKLGVTSQFSTGAESLLWVKGPGNSDGPCGIAPSTPAGTFSPDLAVRLINGT